MNELLLINPNTSAEVTASIDRLAREVLGSSVKLRAVTARFGARYIGSRAGAAIASHAALDAYASALTEGAKPTAIVLACFGDPGLEALREIAGIPVLGFADSGITAAVQRASRFAIATIGEAWGAMLSELVARRGLTPRFAGMISLGEESRSADVAVSHIRVGAERLDADCVVVGGTGLIPIMPAIAAALPQLVLDPHRLTLRLAAALDDAPSAPIPADAVYVGLAPALQRLFEQKL